MKNFLIRFVILVFTVQVSFAQAWMTDLGIAQKLALVENKMVLMVWEGTTEYPYPVWVNNTKGKSIFIENLFADEDVSPLIWEHFVPVIVSEDQYGLMYAKIKGKRSQNYIDKFNDNSIKIMDVNGNILNANSFYYEDLQNISDIIKKYALDTKFINAELKGYQTETTYYSAYYLASKYVDFSMYAMDRLRPDLLRLSNIYIQDAYQLAKKETGTDTKMLQQRCELLHIQHQLILKRPKRVLRLLKKMDAEDIENANTPLIAFLYYTAYMSSGDKAAADKWKSKVSSVNLKKADLIINLNT